MNYIVNTENADQELLEKVIRTLDSQGFKKVGYKAIYTALRVFTNTKGKNCYNYGSYIGYLAYRNAGMKDYANADTMSLATVLTLLTSEKDEPIQMPKPLCKLEPIEVKVEPILKVTNTAKELYSTDYKAEPIITQEPELKLNKDKVIAAYNQTSPELQQFMRLLFGSELFVEKTYKVGDKFQKKNETYALAKINMNVVTMMSLETFNNFGNSIQVRDLESISDRELKQLLKVYYSEFKKID